MADDIHGAQFRALVRLSSPADETLAQPGDTCERVAAASLPWLWSQGLIAWLGDALTTAPSEVVTHG